MADLITCPITDESCSEDVLYLPQIWRKASVACPEGHPINRRLEELLRQLGIAVDVLDLSKSEDPVGAFRRAISSCDFVVSGIGGSVNCGNELLPDPSAVFRAGMSVGMAKPTILLLDAATQAPVGAQPSDLIIDYSTHGGIHTSEFENAFQEKVRIAHSRLVGRFFARDSLSYSRPGGEHSLVLHDFDFLLRLARSVDNLPGDVVCINSALERFMDDSALECLSKTIGERVVEARGAKDRHRELEGTEWDQLRVEQKSDMSQKLFRILQDRRAAFHHCVEYYQWADFFPKYLFRQYLPSEAFRYFGCKLTDDEKLGILRNISAALSTRRYHLFGVADRLGTTSGELIKDNRYHLVTFRGAEYKSVGRFSWSDSLTDQLTRAKKLEEQRSTIASLTGAKKLVRYARDAIVAKNHRR